MGLSSPRSLLAKILVAGKAFGTTLSKARRFEFVIASEVMETGGHGQLGRRRAPLVDPTAGLIFQVQRRTIV